MAKVNCYDCRYFENESICCMKDYRCEAILNPDVECPDFKQGGIKYCDVCQDVLQDDLDFEIGRCFFCRLHEDEDDYDDQDELG